MKKTKFGLTKFSFEPIEIIGVRHLKMLVGAHALIAQCSLSDDCDCEPNSSDCSTTRDVDTDGDGGGGAAWQH